MISNYLHDPERTEKRVPWTGVDWFGVALLAAGLGSLQYVLEEGNQDDWFESNLIVRLTVLSVVCLITLVFWELSPHNENPIVDLRVLKNRTLSASLFLFVSLGFGLYGGIYIFPQFTQYILGFTPTETGLALLPGGIATAVVVVFCGRMMGGPKPVIDPRLLILTGTVIFMISMWMLGHLTTQSGQDDTQFALIIRGAGLGFLFTPINNIAYGSVEPRQAQKAAALINLTRQLGGSFGIAVIGTYVQNMTTFHKVMLSQNIYSGNPEVIARIKAISGNLIAHGYAPSVAQNVAYAQLNNAVGRQASTMSFNNAFIMILLTFLVTAPAVLLLKTKKNAPSGPPPDAH